MQSTRQEILEILKEQREATVEGMASHLGLTPMTIRHHLNVLQAQNLVTASAVRRSQRVGRPRLVYTLTEAADDLFPHGYGELARLLVSEIKRAVGPEQVEQIFGHMAGRLAQKAPPPHEGQTFEERLEQVTGFLEEQGFLFHWEKVEDGYRLVNVNCPYRQVSREHPELCAMDTMLLEELLGVRPQYESRLRAGDAACTCLLVPPG
jgi:DeoR family transcriptional regulator, suf operon transcriptional repressor